ncbi:hypothetical protein F4703DRAFT_1921001, partial [Phycomyces blakesleeanus]
MPKSTIPGLTSSSDSLDYYYLVFARDIALAQPSSDNLQQGSNVKFTTRINNPIQFQKAKVNGIVVSKQSFSRSNKSKDVPNAANCVWLDDSTAILRAFFTERSSRRHDFQDIAIGSQLTLFGKVRRLETNENILLCSGYNVENDLESEVYHWVKTIQQSFPDDLSKPFSDNSNNKDKDKDSSDNRQVIRKIPAKSIFRTLSSQVAEPKSISPETKSPENGFIDLFSENSLWEGSPSHPIFTSTPILKRPQFGSSLNSPIFPLSIGSTTTPQNQ